MTIAVCAPIVEPGPTGVGVYSVNLVNKLAKLCDNLLVYTSYPPAFAVDPGKVRKVSSSPGRHGGLWGS